MISMGLTFHNDADHCRHAITTFLHAVLLEQSRIPSDPAIMVHNKFSKIFASSKSS